MGSEVSVPGPSKVKIELITKKDKSNNQNDVQIPTTSATKVLK